MNRILILLISILFSVSSWSQDLEKTNRLDSAGKKTGIWVTYRGEFPREVAFYVADKLHGPRIIMDDSGFIISAVNYSLGNAEAANTMDSLYPSNGIPFFNSKGFTGRKYWSNAVWAIKDGKLHGLHVNFKDRRVPKNGRVYYVDYNGNSLYLWFTDKKGRSLNAYYLGLKDFDAPVNYVSVKRRQLTIEFLNNKSYPVKVPYLPSRTVNLDMKNLKPEDYWYSGDTIFISLHDSIEKRDFVSSYDHKYSHDPVQFNIADLKIEKVLMPNESVTYTLKIEAIPEKIRYCSFTYRVGNTVVSDQVYRLSE